MLKNTAISEQAADFIAEEIIHERLAGDAPIREQDWAERLGISRGSIREALLILERRHLVEIEPRRGARVARLDPGRAREIGEAWFLLMTAVVERLAPRLDGRSEDELEAALERARARHEGDDLAGFHREVMDLAPRAADWIGHEIFARILRNLMPAVRRAFYRVLTRLPEERERTLDFLDGLVVRLRNGDGRAAAALVRGYAAEELERLARAVAMD